MGSAKTAQVLAQRYNLLERGRHVILAKPFIDDRDGAKTIASRIGISAECEYVEDLFSKNCDTPITAGCVLIVDEAQFLSPEQVDALTDLVDYADINIFCYGLRADFQNSLFPGSARLLAVADVITEIQTYCWCGELATCNARYDENGILRDGSQMLIGGSDRYVSLCRKHFKTGQITPNFVHSCR
jgi:thymidine kinase